MTEEINDANKETISEDVADAGSSPDVELKPIEGDDGLVSTVEYQEVKKEADTQEDTSDDAEQNTSEDPPEKQDFHEHPRFKELIEEKNELKRKLEDAQKPAEKPAKESPSFNNIMSMDDDDIIDQVTSNPKAFFSNLAQQLAYEIKSDLAAAEQARAKQEQELSYKGKVEQNYHEFFKDKPDVKAMMEDGSIKKYIDDHPGHNAISAYYSIAGDASMQEKIKAAEKATEERIYKELKSAGRSKSIATTTGGRILSPDKSPEMTNPDKFGGRDNVLLKRLLARQAS